MKATSILKACRAAIAPPGFAPHMAHVLDLEMMVICDGKERTDVEYRELLAGAGFKLMRIVPTEGPHGLVEAIPA